MRKIFLLFAVLFLSTMTFTSCKKDPTAEEAKALIADADQDLTALLSSVKNGDAATALEKFFEFSKKKIAKDKGTENWLDNMFDKLELVINFDDLDNELDNGRFFFNNYKGLYTWDIATQKWIKTSLDHIAFAFPSEETATSNDILFSFYSYTDASTTIEGDVVWLPTSLHIDIKQDGTKLIAFDLNEMNFDSSLVYFYTKIDASLFVSPVTANYLYDNKTPLNFYSAFNVSDGTNELGYTVDLFNLNPVTEDFDEQDLRDVAGDITINNLVFNYFVNLESIADYPNDYDPTDAEINADINVDVLVDDFKIGFLLIDNDVVYIEYNDGTRESFESAFDGIMHELDSLMTDYDTKNNKMARKQKRKLYKMIVSKRGDFKNIINFARSEYKALSK